MDVSECLSLRQRGLAAQCLALAQRLLDDGCSDMRVKVCKGWALGCVGRYEEAVAVLREAQAESTSAPQKRNIQALLNEFQPCIGFAGVLRERWEEARQQPLGVQWYEATVRARTGVTTNKGDISAYEGKRDGVAYVLGRTDGRWDLDGCVPFSESLSPPFPFPCNQLTDGWIWQKKISLPVTSPGFEREFQRRVENLKQKGKPFTNADVFDFMYRYHRGPMPIDRFPVISDIQHKPGVYQPHPHGDVWVLPNAVRPMCQHTLRTLLDARAAAMADYPMPMYQNIIDPNLLVREHPTQHCWQWSPSVFHVAEVTPLDTLVEVQLIAKELRNAKLPGAAMRTFSEFTPSKRPVANLMTRVHDLDPENDALLHRMIEEVFNAAVPLLAELRRPALLLPGPLQAVVKAQRIYLEPGQEYEGVWHYDGKQEDIVAVAIYYYRCSPDLEGGALEFMDRSPRHELFWVEGDCTPDPLTKDDVRAYYEEKPHCKVPVGEGTLVVFSNYQFIHRVLRMKHTGSSGLACRDFLLFFIVDQRAPLHSTTEEVTPGSGNSYQLRDTLLHEQLQPVGTFGISSEYVYSTGNGSVAQLGWLRSGDRQLYSVDDIHCSYRRPPERTGIRHLKSFDYCPPVGRGLSWVFEAPDEELCNFASDYYELRRHEGPEESSPYTSVYVHMPTSTEQKPFPLEGICQIVHEFAEREQKEPDQEESEANA